ncbi:MAG: glycosyltransferase family 2 protein [Bacteroidota bacterium]
MTAISAVIITKNEAENISRCLEALQPVVAEILVVDSMSEDATVDICQQAGARVVQTDWQGYARTKNYANSLASHDWILSIDADEVLSASLQASLRQLQPHTGCVYSLDRITNFCGRWIKHSEWYPDWKLRLFDRRHCHWTGDYVHETLQYPSQSQVIRLEGRLLHYSYKSLDDHWNRLEKYTQLAAEALYEQKKPVTWVKLWLSPPLRFWRTFILGRGFLDGKWGWIISKRNAQMVRMKYQKLRALYRQSS